MADVATGVMDSCTEPRKGLILHSGAIGDCLLTLPLAAFMKQACGLTQVHFMGRPDAAGFFPRRSGIDYVRAMESVPLHRLFEPEGTFTLDDPDRLITAFAGYQQIVSFLGTGHPDFEQNLLMTVHCSHAAEVVMLPMAPPPDSAEHVSAFYVRAFAGQVGLEPQEPPRLESPWLAPTPEDRLAGRDILAAAGVDPDASVAVIHPGSGGRHKCWHFENFIRVAEALAERGVGTVFLFGPAEQERFAREVKRRFRDAAAVLDGLELTDVLQLLSQADVFVGNDSGISHLAGAMGIKTVAIFGPTDPTRYRPLGPAVTVYSARPEGFEAPCPDDAAALLSHIDGLP